MAYRLRLFILCLLCAVAATAQPRPCSTVGDARLDGYKGRVKEVEVKTWDAVWRNGQWQPDTLRDNTYSFKRTTYDEHGSITGLTQTGGKNIGIEMLYTATFRTIGNKEREMHLELKMNDELHMLSTEHAHWLSDNVLCVNKQVYLPVKDSAYADGYNIISYTPVSCATERYQVFAADSALRVTYNYATHNDSMFITTTPGIRDHASDTTYSIVLRKDARHNPLKTLTVSGNTYSVAYYTYKYYNQP